jgi:uncharacterized protein YicC (UPF0701 family)
MARKVPGERAPAGKAIREDFDIEMSMADFESMITDAANDLVEVSKQAQPAAPAMQRAQQPAVEPAVPAFRAVEPAPRKQAANQAASAATPLAPSFSAANDPDIRSVFDPFSEKPSATPYWIAFGLTLAWIAGGYLLSTAIYGTGFFGWTSFAEMAERPGFVGTAIGVIVPILGFWAFAIMISNAQSLRIAARSMTKVAYRLTEPDKVAEEKVSSLAQAIRREVNSMNDGIERTLTRAVELESLLHGEINELERAYGDNEARMRGLIDGLGSERLEIIGHAERFRATLDGASEQFATNINDTVEGLRAGVSTAGEEFARSVAISREDIMVALLQTGGQIEQRISAKSAAFGKAIESAAHDLEELIDGRANVIAASIEDGTTRLASTLAEREDFLTVAIDDRSAILTRALGSASDALSAALDSKLDKLEIGIIARGEGLVSTLDDRIIGVESAAEKLESVVDAGAGRINDALNSRITEIAKTFTEGREGFSALIETGREGIAEDLDGFLASASKEIEKHAGKLTDAYGAASDIFTGKIDQRLERLETGVIARGEGLVEALDERITGIEASAAKLDGVVGTGAARINETLNERIREIASTFGQGRDGFGALIEGGKESLSKELQSFVVTAGAAIDDSVDRLAKRVADVRSGFEGNLTGEVNRVEDTLNAHRDFVDNRLGDFEKTLAARADIFEQRVEAHGLSLDESVARKAIELDARIAGHVGVLNSAIDERAGLLEVKAQEAAAAFDAAVESKVARLQESVSGSADIIEGSVREVTDRLGEMVGMQVAELDGLLTERSSELAATLGAQTLEISAALAAAGDQVSNLFDGRVDIIGAQTEAMSAALERGMAGVGVALGAASRNAGEQLREAVREASTALYAGATEASRVIGEREAGITERMIAALNEGQQIVISHAAALESGLAEARVSIVNSADAIVGRVTGLEEVLDRADQRTIMRTHQTSFELNARAEAMSTMLAGYEARIGGRLADVESLVSLRADSTIARIEDASRLIERSTTETGSTIEQRTRELAEALQRNTTEIERILEDSGDPLVERIEETAAEFRTMLDEAGRSASEHLTSEIDRLASSLEAARRDTSEAFTAHANTVEERARSVGQSLATQVNELIDRLAVSNAKLGELASKTGVSLAEIDQGIAATTAAFSASAEKAARELAASVSAIDGNTGRLEELSSVTLSEITGIVTRFDEHGRALQKANELLSTAQSNLQHTLEERREALDALASTLVTRSREIESVMNAVNGAVSASLADAEGKTKATAEHLGTSIASAVDAAAARFAEATSEVERTAAMIRKELETTREDVHRGLSELPAETLQTTDQMRRAVNEQIGALRELTDVMSKSSRTRDAREPQAEPVRRVQAAPAAAVAQVVAQQPAPRVQAPEAPIVRQPQAVQQAAPAVAAPAARADAQPRPDGWVSTLLNGVNKSAAETDRRPAQASRPAAQVIDSLNSLAVDIARGIDHEEAVRLWDRYRRGERDVFTRRLYTLRGQETFDEIRRKYETDRDFRIAVVRYCEDFEKLLRDVARDDRDGATAQRYLTSDTGKVFTMLAHASGRLR